jgi:hypothetical protein
MFAIFVSKNTTMHRTYNQKYDSITVLTINTIIS